MYYIMSIFSQAESAKFKNLIASAKNIIPTELNIVALNGLLQALMVKKNELNVHLSSNVTAGQKNTLKIYLDDIHEVINLTEARINQLNNQEVGGARRRRSSRRRSSRRKRSSRRRH